MTLPDLSAITRRDGWTMDPTPSTVGLAKPTAAALNPVV